MQRMKMPSQLTETKDYYMVSRKIFSFLFFLLKVSWSSCPLTELDLTLGRDKSLHHFERDMIVIRIMLLSVFVHRIR